MMNPPDAQHVPTATLRPAQVAALHLGACREHHADNGRKFVAWVSRERPALVVVNGDLIMNDPDD